MRNYIYLLILLLATPFIINCKSGLSSEEIVAEESSTPSLQLNTSPKDEPSLIKSDAKSSKPDAHATNKPESPKAAVDAKPLQTKPVPEPEKPVIAPLVLSLDQIRAQQAKLTMGEAIDEFNQLKTKVGVYTRETLDNYMRALLHKNFDADGGVVENDTIKFMVSGLSIEIQESPDQWKKIDTDGEDRRVLLKWMLDNKLGLSYHMFEYNTAELGINFLEQAVAWNELEFVKDYFNFNSGAAILDIDENLNSELSTPLAFATSVPMAQFLLAEGANPKVQVGNLENQDKTPLSVLQYLAVTKAPQDVIDLVKMGK